MQLHTENETDKNNWNRKWMDEWHHKYIFLNQILKYYSDIESILLSDAIVGCGTLMENFIAFRYEILANQEHMH